MPPAGAGSELDLGGRGSDPGAERRSSAPGEVRSSDPTAKLGDTFGIVGSVQAGTFQVEKVVAHGGFGVIYRAKHVGFRAPVALKCLKIPETLTGPDRDQFLERFRSEGEVMFRLSSSIPEVVRPLQVDFLKTTRGVVVPFIALEWLEGETLKDLIVGRLEANKPPIRIERAVPYLTPVARALSRAHRFPGPDGQPLAIVHCDLKPDNIFVVRGDAGDSFKIFDFGIAKVRLAASREAGGATRAGSNMFTPAYAAPEQWAPDRFGQTGPWTDVYAFALSLTELLTQRPAIDGSPASMLRQALDEANRPTPRRLGLDLPESIDAIFARAMAVSPKDRIQSVEAFWTELENALHLPESLSGRLSVASMPAVRSSLDDDAPPPLRPGSASQPAAVAPAVGGMPDLALAPAAPPALPSALGMPLAPPAAAPALALESPSPAAAPPSPSPEAHAPLGGGSLSLELDRPAAPPAAAPPAAASGLPSISSPGIPIQGAPPASPSVPSMPAALPGAPLAPPSGTGLVPPGLLPLPGEAAPESAAIPQAPVSARLGAAASKAGVVASRAGEVASEAAKSLARKALEVDERHRIQLDKPETWLRPMRAPLIVMALAVLITFGAIIANRFMEEQVKVTWVSAPLILISVGFAVYRWVKLQDDSQDD